MHKNPGFTCAFHNENRSQIRNNDYSGLSLLYISFVCIYVYYINFKASYIRFIQVLERGLLTVGG